MIEAEGEEVIYKQMDDRLREILWAEATFMKRQEAHGDIAQPAPFNSSQWVRSPMGREQRLTH